jgi:glycosyltransferase involved in cell wall biosynthesis
MNRKKHLLVVKGDINEVNSSLFGDEYEIISFKNFKNYFKIQSIFFNLFSRQCVALKVYRYEFLSFPLLTMFMLRIVSRRCPFIIDNNSERYDITFLFIFKIIRIFLSDWMLKNKIISCIEERLDIQNYKYNEIKKINRINEDGVVVYLRTDLWFGLSSGGSIGHIAGVLNQFHQKIGVLFLTSDYIPTVQKDVKTDFLKPTNRFWDFREIPTFASNICFDIQSAKIIENYNVSFIYQRYSLNNLTGVTLAQNLRVPFVLEYNGSEIWISRNWGLPLKYKSLSEKIENFNLSMADLVVVVSQPMKDELVSRNIESNKILVNPNGVDPEIYSPEIDGSNVRKLYSLENKFVIGFIGTFGPWHGAEVLAEAFARLVKESTKNRDNLHLLMIGDGIRLSVVKSIITSHGLDARCTFAGTVAQVDGPSYLAACDILAAPNVPNLDGTPFFGSPTKMFEYMAMGKGIVASDLDQIGEILVHDKTAWKVRPGNVLELANGLECLVDDSNLRERLGLAARIEVIEKYTWEVHTNNIMVKLRECLDD